MAKGASFANDLLLLLFQNTNIANMGDTTGVRGSTTAGSLFVALHTADPSAGDQTTSETNYSGYARIGVVRSSAGWTVSGSSASNAAAVTFGKCTAGSATITHVSIGLKTSGASRLMYSAPLATQLVVAPNIIPNLAIGAISVTES